MSALRTDVQASEVRMGLIASLGAYAMWGVLPLYLKAVGFASPEEVLALRILWCVPATLAAVWLIGGWRQSRDAVSAPGMLRTLTLSAILIGLNWWIYVWAVANDHIIEASLAYFLAPLIGVALGVIFFQERLSRWQFAALSLAGVGVLVQAVALGQAPWVAIGLCATWSAYALIRKRAPVPAAGGLLVEALVLAPFAMLGLFALSSGPAPLATTESASNAFWLALSGPFTAAPLILFAIGARRLRFTTLGLLQYLAPTMQFLIGVAYGEPFTPLRAVSFALIWIGLAAYSIDAFRQEPSPAAPIPDERGAPDSTGQERSAS